MWTDWQLVRARIDLEHSKLMAGQRLTPALLVQKLLVSGEDHRHGKHCGFDVIAILRALWRRLSRQSREGASTIEQQVVRVITARYERTLSRKLREIGLAILVASHYSKELLPAIYLSIGYYGWKMNGYEAACKRLGLYGKALSLTDAAAVVARLKYPQPKNISKIRGEQIERRVRHLKRLYQTHSKIGTYRHLHVSAIRNCATTFNPIPRTG